MARHSGAAVSDDESDPTSDIDVPKTPAATKLPATHVVSEPKHKSAKKFRSATGASLTAVGDFLEQKSKIDKERFEALQQREKRLVAEAALKREADARQQHLDMARTVIATEGIDEEVKDAAKQCLLDFFKF